MDWSEMKVDMTNIDELTKRASKSNPAESRAVDGTAATMKINSTVLI